MAHIALIVTGLTGNLHASLELASRFKKEGNKITYLAIRDVKIKVENNGFNYIQLPEITHSISTEDLGLTQGATWFKKFIFSLRDKRKNHKKIEDLLKLEEYKNIIASIKPDITIIDRELHDIIFAVFSLKIPIVISTTWFSNKMGSGLKLPPIRTNIIPGKGIKGTSLFILFNWIYIKLKVRARIIANKIFFKDYRRQGLLNYANKVGFPTKEIVASNLPNLFVYPHIKTLSMTMNEMDFNHIPDKELHYIGPMVFESRDNNASSKISEKLKTIFNQKLNDNKKLIFCSVSTLVSGDIIFLKKLISAVSNVNNYQLIITLGDKIDKNIFKNTPENVYLFNWVPQLEVLKHADLNINHGGINSINECIHFKVPMLVYSGKNFDQNGCAARIHYHGLGIMGDKDKDSSKEIKEKLERILSDKIYTENLNKFNKIYINYQQKNLSKILKLKS